MKGSIVLLRTSSLIGKRAELAYTGLKLGKFQWRKVSLSPRILQIMQLDQNLRNLAFLLFTYDENSTDDNHIYIRHKCQRETLKTKKEITNLNNLALRLDF